MSKLEELLKELCPDGVEYVRLNKICKIYDGTHQTPTYTASGVKFVSVENINSLYDTQKYISEEDFKKYKIKPQIDDVFMTRIGSIGVCTVVERSEPLAYYVSLALLRPDTQKASSKFLKYVIESLQGRKELRKRTLVNAVPIKINKDDIGKITIPVPPLPVQNEIVRILDNFTELTAELKTQLAMELAARKKQYEYYASKLIMGHNGGEEYEKVLLGDIADFTYGFTDKARESGTARFIRITDIGDNGYLKQVDAKYIELTEASRKYLLKAGNLLMARTGATYGKTLYMPNNEPSVYASFLIKITLQQNKLLNKFYWHFTRTQYYWEQANKLVSAGGQPQFNTGAISRVMVPVPPLEEQQRIVAILDRFDTLCNDISSGLPAEIEARTKQYEYYRDKLLTFQERA